MARNLKWGNKIIRMKRNPIILIISFGLMSAFGQTPKGTEIAKAIKPKELSTLRKLNNGDAFKPGEVLEYFFHYGIIDAGSARIELKDEARTIGGRKIYHVVGTGKTNRAFDWFFKVRDTYETFIDAEGVFPWLFIRRVDEGGYIINQDYKFLQTKDKVDNGKGEMVDAPEYIQDMLSAFYFSRTMDYSKAKKGDIFTIVAFVDNEVYPLKIKYQGIETISVREGKFNCMKFYPVVQQGRIFKKEEDMSVYITNDKNKIPVLVEAQLLVGSIKMELLSYSGLAHPISKVK